MNDDMTDDMTSGAETYDLSTFYRRAHDFNTRAATWLEDGKALAAERGDLVENSRRYGAMKKQTDEALARLSLAPAKVKKVKTVEAAPILDYIAGGIAGGEDGAKAGAHE